MIKGVIACIQNKGKVLLIKRKDLKIWSLPGGIIESNESHHNAVIREVLEETNVQIVPQELFGVYIRTIPFLEDITFAYNCTLKKSNLKTSIETDAVIWVSLKRASKLVPQFIADIIRDSLSTERGTPVVRTVNYYPLSIVLKFFFNKTAGLIKQLF